MWAAGSNFLGVSPFPVDSSNEEQCGTGSFDLF